MASASCRSVEVLYYDSDDEPILTEEQIKHYRAEARLREQAGSQACDHDGAARAAGRCCRLANGEFGTALDLHDGHAYQHGQKRLIHARMVVSDEHRRHRP